MDILRILVILGMVGSFILVAMFTGGVSVPFSLPLLAYGLKLQGVPMP
jgi:hypothetical protein